MARSDSNSSPERNIRKKKRRSRSRSTSRHKDRKTAKSKSKKSKRSKRSRSRSVSKTRGRHYSPKKKSRSRSRGRHSRSRSRGRSSRSLSRGRRSRSRSQDRRSPGARRRRSRSHSKTSDSHSKQSSHRSTPDVKEKRKQPKTGEEKDLSEMAPIEQAKLRMKMALDAAVASDDKLKEKGGKNDEMSVTDQARFHQAMDDINCDSFNPVAFTSNRSTPKASKTEIGFGTSCELILGPAEQTKVISTESYAHPNLNKDPEESMTKWLLKLTAMRYKLLKDTVT